MPCLCIISNLYSALKSKDTEALYVTLLYWGQTVGWIKMPLGREEGLNQGYIVLDGDSLHPKKRHSSPHFSAHVYFGQTAGCIRIPLGMEVGLGQATLC